YAIPAISTGAIIREAIQNGTEMGLSAKSFIEAGALVPDEVVIGIIKDRLAQSDCENGFILDGFPRTIPQAEALDQMGIVIDRVISIEVPDDKIAARMAGRRVCPKCGASYHTEYKKPAKEGVCNACGAELVQRKDDAPETVLERLHVYHEQTEPLKGYYENAGKLRLVEGQEEVKDTTALTLKALED
ncbi:MAG: adenylate kinase, partial [Acutalibacteraceae bacterium]|nr:adenylate kinase [Acutalibacteraceae bacterium]